MLQSHTQEPKPAMCQGIVAQVQLQQLHGATQRGGEVGAAAVGKVAPPQPGAKHMTRMHITCAASHLRTCLEPKQGPLVFSHYKGKIIMKFLGVSFYQNLNTAQDI